MSIDNIDAMFLIITRDNSKETVWEKVQEAKSEFITSWEDDFESINEAYEEQGRNEAEDQVIGELMTEVLGGATFSSTECCKLFEILADHYELQITH